MRPWYKPGLVPPSILLCTGPTRILCAGQATSFSRVRHAVGEDKRENVFSAIFDTFQLVFLRSALLGPCPSCVCMNSQ
eukprot:3102433-Prymnesium_polylepis.1